MANTIKQFFFLVMQMKKSDQFPSNPIVTICLDNWSPTKDGVPVISPHLMSEGEIDDYVEALKADLDAVNRRAKAALKKAKASTKKIVSERILS